MIAEDPTPDNAPPGDGVAGTEPGLEENLKSRSTWMRGFFMVVCFAIYAVTRFVVFGVVVLQFFWALFTSAPNERLIAFGHSLALFTCEVIDFLTYYTDERPFPFDRDWPVGS